MKSVVAASLVAVVSTASAVAAIKTERVEYKVGGETFAGTLAYDDAAKEARPGVLVCHEWWGCNAYAAKRATMLAEQGYVAFALDMYGKDQQTEDPKQAGEWAQALYADPAKARAKAAAGLKVLAEHAKTDRTRLAAIGYCMGGTVALELARSGLEHTANLKAIVCFHTSTIAAKTASDNGNIKGSVLVCHGADDTFVGPEQIPAFQKQMGEAKVDYQFLSFSGTVHSFTNPDADKFKIDGVKYNASADRRSWAAMKSLFAETFGGAPGASPAPAAAGPSDKGAKDAKKP